MKQADYIISLLDMIDRPAFCVKSDRIIRCNQMAQRFLLSENVRFRSLIINGLQEYGLFQSGNLHLTLNLAGTTQNACVSRISGIDLVTVESESADADLQSLALAAQSLRQHLATMSLSAEALAGNHDPAAQAHLARLNKSVYQLLRLTENMSDAYSYTLECTPFMEQRDIVALLQEIFDGLGKQLSKADIRLVFDCSVESVYTMADRMMLERAVGNLISNAVRFAVPKSIVEASLTRNGNMLYLTVANDGESILGASGGNVFQQFRRAPGLEDGQKGLGLGLHLVRSAATAHGGTVLIQNSDSGSRITMTLAVRQGKSSTLRDGLTNWTAPVSYDRNLIELADILPASAFDPKELV